MSSDDSHGQARGSRQIYDPEHSEQQTELLLAAATSEEWTLEDLKTLASQPDLEKMQSLQHKMEQLYHVQK